MECQRHHWAWRIGLALPALALLGYFSLPHGDPIMKTAPFESHAIATLRAIAESQRSFQLAHNGSFAETLDILQYRSNDRGYTYALTVIARNERGEVTAYTVNATPTFPGKTGIRYFSIDEGGNIHWENMRTTDAHSRSLE